MVTNDIANQLPVLVWYTCPQKVRISKKTNVHHIGSRGYQFSNYFLEPGKRLSRILENQERQSIGLQSGYTSTCHYTLVIDRSITCVWLATVVHIPECWYSVHLAITKEVGQPDSVNVGSFSWPTEQRWSISVHNSISADINCRFWCYLTVIPTQSKSNCQ